MPNIQFADYASTVLAQNITAGQTSFNVASSALFPALTGAQYFYATIVDLASATSGITPPAAREVVKVTAVSGTLWTVERGAGGTAQAFSQGDVVELRVTAAALNALRLDEVVDIRDYGAAGDGVTNDTTAVQAWLTASTGKIAYAPVGTYITDLVAPAANTRIIGDGANQTIFKRKPNATGGAVFNCGVAGLEFSNLAIDGNKSVQTVAAHNLLLFGCTGYSVSNVRSINAKAVAGGSGCGIAIVNGGSGNTRGRIAECDCSSNDVAGIFVDGEWFLDIDKVRCVSNGGHGVEFINLVFPPIADIDVFISLRNSVLKSNGGAGAAFVGGYTGGVLGSPIYGNSVPPHRMVNIEGNHCYLNTQYGLAFQGAHASIANNHCHSNGSDLSNGGMLVNAAHCSVVGNHLYKNSCYGIDGGGSTGCTFTGNVFTENGTAGYANALNLGATIECVVSSNVFENNGGVSGGHTIFVAGFDADGAGVGLDQHGTDAVIANNRIALTGGQVGIWVTREYGPGVLTGNVVTGGTLGYDYILDTKSSWRQQGNIGNDGVIPFVASANPLVIPDVCDVIYVTGAIATSDIMSRTFNTNLGKVRSVTITNGGTGYSPSSPPGVTFSGGGGTGAAGTAVVSNSGAVVGILMTNNGSGYTSAPTVGFASGVAAGTANVDSMNVNDGRTLDVMFLSNGTHVGTGGRLILNRGGYTFNSLDNLRLRGASGEWLEAGQTRTEKVVAKTGDYAITIFDSIVTIDATSGNVTLTLPSDVSFSGAKVTSEPLLIKRLDSSGNTVTVQRAGSDTIDAGASTTTIAANSFKRFLSTGSGAWYTV